MRNDLLCAILLILIVIPAFAIAGSISGSLYLGEEMITESMEVSITEYGSDEWTSTTTEDGNYLFADLADGQYCLKARSLEGATWIVPICYPNTWHQSNSPAIQLEDDVDLVGINFMMFNGGKFSGSVIPAEGGQFPAYGIGFALIELDWQTGFETGLFPFENPSDYTSVPCPPGIYYIRFIPEEPDLHVPYLYGGTLNVLEAETVEIAEQQTVENMDIALPPGGGISGNLTVEGEPVAGTAAVAITIDPDMMMPMMTLGSIVDENGDYLIRGVPTGDCFVMFAWGGNEEYPEQFYDNAYDFLMATSIMVTENTIIEGIDGNLVPGVSFSGTVTSPGDLPYDIGIQVNNPWGGDEVYINVDIQPDGSWTGNEVFAPGIYTLRVSWIGDEHLTMPYLGDVYNPWEATWLMLEGGVEFDQADFNFETCGAVSGTVLDPDGNPVTNAEVLLFTGSNEIEDTEVDDNGDYLIGHVLPGNYKLAAMLTDIEEFDPMTVWPVTYSGDVFFADEATEIVVNAGETTVMDLQFGYGGMLEVTITDPDGLPYSMSDSLGLMTGLLQADDTVLWQKTSSVEGIMFGDETEYMIVPPADYKIACIPLFVRGMMEMDMLPVQRTFYGGSFFPGEASLVTVTAQETETIEIAMVEGGHTISGEVSAEWGDIYLPPMVVAFDENGLFVSAHASFDFFNRELTYSINGLPDGDYFLFANYDDDHYLVNTWYPDAGDPECDLEGIIEPPPEAGIVTVAGSDIEGVDIVMQMVDDFQDAHELKPPPVIRGYELHGAWPNPFNDFARISFTLPKTSRVRLTVFNLLGREVMQVEDGIYTSGTHHAQIDCKGLSSGMYIVRMESGAFRAARKLVLLK